MKLLFYAGLILASILIAALTFVVVAAPTDFVREQLIAKVKAKTGWTLEIRGGTSLTFFPRLGIAPITPIL